MVPGCKDRTRARSLCEALKSDVYFWSAKAGDHRGDSTDNLLREATDQLLSDAGDLLRHRQGTEPEQRSNPDLCG